MRSGQRTLVRSVSEEEEVAMAAAEQRSNGPASARRSAPVCCSCRTTAAASHATPRHPSAHRRLTPTSSTHPGLGRRPPPLRQVAQVRAPAAPAPRAVHAPEGAPSPQPLRHPPRGQEPGRGAVQAAAQVGALWLLLRLGEGGGRCLQQQQQLGGRAVALRRCRLDHH